MLLCFVCLASPVDACNIPVFRYALERWQSDDYEVIVYDKDAAEDVDQQSRARLTVSHSNTAFVVTDFTQASSSQLDLLKSLGGQPKNSKRYFVVRAPDGEKIVAHGQVQDNTFSRLLDSPVRQELSRRLLSGHAIVWLLVQSSDETQNIRTRKLLSKTIEALADRIELPEGIGLPGSELHSEVPLLLRFSLLEIQPDNADESFLRELFSGYDRGSVVVPVFGRGRALEVIPAAQVTESLVEDVTVYLCGACSCQVKERNPGFDLLIATNWERELFGDQQPPRDQPQHTQRQRGKQPPNLLTIPPGRSSKP
jgi:hypothetical protein